MFKPALLAVGAGLVLAASIAAPQSASAQGWGPPGPPPGPGWGGPPPPHPGWGPGWGRPGWGHPGGCRPVYRKVQVRGPYGWRWRTVQVGTRCYGPPRW